MRYRRRRVPGRAVPRNSRWLAEQDRSRWLGPKTFAVLQNIAALPRYVVSAHVLQNLQAGKQPLVGLSRQIPKIPQESQSLECFLCEHVSMDFRPHKRLKQRFALFS